MHFNERRVGFPLLDVNLRDATDPDLDRTSRELRLGLSVEEMRRVRDQFLGEGRNPTDVELQAIGQAWSEHCCYKSSRFFLKKYIIDIDSPDVLAREDAGIVAIDDKWAYALRIESHNHPSAIEPYGGAATGIGGIVRDVLCMGAQPVALIDPLYFGPLDMPQAEVPRGIKHPKALLAGVVAGIRDYGNRIGIPTVSGGLNFHRGYVGNCIVNVGCVGVLPRDRIIHSAVGGVGDVLVLVGGRTGRDGIHGVTFASAVLTKDSEEESRGAVQLGDPITKEPLIHACLEATDRGLLRGMKDLGGGGLSCVVGEISLAGGTGAEVDISRVPLKEEGLEPWEIWVSESQERMMLAVAPKDVKEVLEIFALWDVEATVLGHTIPETRVRVDYRGVKVLDMAIEFYTSGPEYCRPYKVEKPKPPKGGADLPEDLDPQRELLGLLGDANVCSREWVVRQYDHEVRASTAVGPLRGALGHAGPQDASVLAPIEGSWQGIALATSYCPTVTAHDPYRGGLTVIDEMCRALVAVGARPSSLTNCLNFGNPEVPERMGEFVETVRGMGDALRHIKVPAPSGNVSFYNETPESAVPPTASVLGVGLMDDARRAVTTDLKRAGDRIYLVGVTRDEMAGSALYMRHGAFHAEAPDVDLDELASSIEGMLTAHAKGLIVACHDVSEGGMAVALAEMCIGGQLGADVDLDASSRRGLRRLAALFSESNTRWLCEVPPADAKGFERVMGAAGVTVKRIGVVVGPGQTAEMEALAAGAAGKGKGAGKAIGKGKGRGKGKATAVAMLKGTEPLAAGYDRPASLVVRAGGKALIDVPLPALEEAWTRTIWDLMG